ncbi:hypothetical protein MAR_006718, partial [Mya arenaria]
SNHGRIFLSITHNTFNGKNHNGRNTSSGVDFLQNKISKRDPLIFPTHGRSIVLFWHGTCDVTQMARPEKTLTPKYSSNAEYMAYLVPQLQSLVSIHQGQPFDIGVLETPHTFMSSDEDIRIQNQITEANDFIRDSINTTLSYRSPKFNCDLLIFRKKKARRSTSVSSSLYTDGIHPRPELCRKWLYQIILSVVDASTNK